MYIYVPHVVLFILIPIAVILLLRFLSLGHWINARAAGIPDVSIAALIGMALFVVALISIPAVHDMFLERAKAIQPYDIGPGGRFWEQRLALGVILESPNGLGPFEFFRIYGTQQHDVYMQAFLVYGWIGGTAYLALVVVTLAAGFRASLVPAPWQAYLIAAYAAFVGEAIEGFIVDTDHWRHFFLILGVVWGLTAASINLRRSEPITSSKAGGLVGNRQRRF